MTRKILDNLVTYRAELARLEEKLSESRCGKITVAEKALLWRRRCYYRHKRRALAALMLRAEHIFDKLSDPMYGIVLRYKFIDEKTIEQISELLNYSPRHMHRIFAAAVAECEKMSEL